MIQVFHFHFHFHFHFTTGNLLRLIFPVGGRNKTGGRRHLLILPDDHGGCDMKDVMEEWENATYLVHYGFGQPEASSEERGERGRQRTERKRETDTQTRRHADTQTRRHRHRHRHYGFAQPEASPEERGERGIHRTERKTQTLQLCTARGESRGERRERADCGRQARGSDGTQGGLGAAQVLRRHNLPFRTPLPCFTPGKDVVLPPMLGARLGQTQEEILDNLRSNVGPLRQQRSAIFAQMLDNMFGFYYWLSWAIIGYHCVAPFEVLVRAKPYPGGERANLLFFAGSVAMAGEGGKYSQGVRQAVYRLYNSTRGFYLVDLNASPLSTKVRWGCVKHTAL
eukprot:1189564-Prorocentrum_minimum.AAC.8